MFNKIKNFLFDTDVGVTITFIVIIIVIGFLSGITGEIYGL